MLSWPSSFAIFEEPFSKLLLKKYFQIYSYENKKHLDLPMTFHPDLLYHLSYMPLFLTLYIIFFLNQLNISYTYHSPLLLNTLVFPNTKRILIAVIITFIILY